MCEQYLKVLDMTQQYLILLDPIFTFLVDAMISNIGECAIIFHGKMYIL